MKRAAFIAVVISLLMSACKTQQQAVSLNNDDVYSTPSRPPVKTNASPKFDQDLTSALASDQTAVAHDSLKAKAATLDYSDLSYADRIKKFQHPQDKTSYFNNTTTDTTYIYSNNPNISVNLGYGGGYDDWGSSFSMGFGMGYGWGWPYYGWGYGWGYPYYWDYPYWSYYNPYCYCCYNPYWEGGYYNSYYGPRHSTATNTAYSRNNRSDAANTAAASRNDRTPVTGNERPSSTSSVRSTTQNGTPSRSGTQTVPVTRSTNSGAIQGRPSASPERYHYTRPASDRQGTSSRNTGQGTVSRDTRQQPSPKYTQPGTAPVQRQGQVQNYTPGNYRQARSSQEYINPRVQAQNSAGAAATSGNRGGSSVNQRGYSSPGNSAGSRRSVSGPGNQYNSSPRNYSPGNSSPSRSYSPGYSAPSGGSRSGGGGFSGGSSGGGRSGGSSGGGGGGGSPRR